MYFTPSLRVTLAVLLSELKGDDSLTSFFAASILARVSGLAMKNNIKARSVLFPPIT